VALEKERGPPVKNNTPRKILLKTAILGLGNELLGDEGVGVHAIRLLAQKKMPEDTILVEVGTAILDALPILEKAENIIIIDAMKGDEIPGTVYAIDLDHCKGSGCIASMHGFDIFRTMAIAGRTEAPNVKVFGVEPEFIGWSLELSENVSRSLPYLIEGLYRELDLR
jgi:hydrogenase maturation protease